MKPNLSIVIFLLYFSIVSCGGPSNNKVADVDSTLILKTAFEDSFSTSKIINPVICKADPTQSYALYIPADKSNQPLPIIYFFDPHGDGLLPIKKYKSLADTFHFILVGSNNSKNGNDWNNAENIWGTLKDDVQKRIAINRERIYTCGFSGGAKVASFLALHHPEIKGVIANGAGLEEITTSGNFKFSLTAIAGKGDMNMTSLISIDKSLENTQTKHRIIFFDGIHEWAPLNIMKTAFSGLQLDAMRNNLIPRDSFFINQFVVENKNKITDDEKSNQLLKAESSCQYSINMLDGVTDKVNWFHKTKDSITQTASYKNQSKANEDLLQKEENIKAGFQEQFQIRDEGYWSKVIKDVKEKTNEKTSEGLMYQRLQAYLSLAFYSISSQIIGQNHNKDAEYFVELYKMADPTNSEAWYLSAILNARENNSAATKDDLLKAVSLGFNDKKRLEQQPDFSNSGIKINLAEIESKMK